MQFLKALWNSKSTRLTFTLAMICLALFFIADAFQAYKAGKWVMGSLDLILMAGFVHQWLTRWADEIK